MIPSNVVRMKIKTTYPCTKTKKTNGDCKKNDLSKMERDSIQGLFNCVGCLVNQTIGCLKANVMLRLSHLFS